MPPPGHATHHDHFRLCALDQPLRLQAGATREPLLAAMQDHGLDEGDLVGTCERRRARLSVDARRRPARDAASPPPPPRHRRGVDVAMTALVFDAGDPVGCLRDAVARAALSVGPLCCQIRVLARELRHLLCIDHLEQELADVAREAIRGAGHDPRVGHAEPEVVLVVQIVGHLADVFVQPAF